MNRKKFLRRLKVGAASTAFLLSGISAYTLRQVDKVNAEEFAKSVVVFRGDTIPLQEFYENLEFKKDKWVYRARNNKKYKLSQLTDFVNKYNRHKGQEWQKNQKNRYLKIDTVYYERMSTKQPDGGHYRYTKNGVTLSSMPAMGKNTPHGIILTQLEPKNGERDYKIDKYNDEYNATKAHEGQHNINGNPGPDLDNPTNLNQLGQSYDLMFAERCWDEIIANIKQLLKQRQNYLDDNKNIKRITPRFQPYADAVSNQTVKPISGYVSAGERKLIADIVFNGWMEEKFPIYYDREMKKVKRMCISLNTNGNVMQKNEKKHIYVLINKMHIQDQELGIDLDFFLDLFPKEREILNRIKPKDRKEFEKLSSIKEARQTHLEDLEKTRMLQGEKAYLKRVRRNAYVAKLNKKINSIKRNFGR